MSQKKIDCGTQAPKCEISEPSLALDVLNPFVLGPHSPASQLDMSTLHSQSSQAQAVAAFEVQAPDTHEVC